MLDPEHPEYETLFVLPQFLNAGRFSYIIEHPKGTFYFHKSLIHFRKEPLPLNVISPEEEYLVDFVLAKSVFSEFKYPDDPIVQTARERAIAHDLGSIAWKLALPNAIGPGPMQDCKNYYEKHFDAFMYAYRRVLAEAEEPRGVDLPSLTKFLLGHCKAKRLTEEVIAKEFNKSTEILPASYKIPRDKEKPKELLCRKEFLELLVRLGLYEHPDNQEVEALDLLLRQTILARLPPASSIQDFRDNELFTKQVNDILEENRQAIINVLRLYNSGKPHVRYQDLYNIFLLDSWPRIIKKKQTLVSAVALTKKAVVRDFQAEFGMLDRISDLEFFEILGRVVDLQSAGTVMED